MEDIDLPVPAALGLMLLLDTHVLSELRTVRSGKANPGVGAWATAIPSAGLFISAITIYATRLAGLEVVIPWT